MSSQQRLAEGLVPLCSQDLSLCTKSLRANAPGLRARAAYLLSLDRDSAARVVSGQTRCVLRRLMGAVLSTHGPVQLVVKVNSKGSKIIKSKFTCQSPASDATIYEYYRVQVLPMVNAKDVGKLLQVCVIPRDCSHEVEVESLDDLAVMYASMGLTRVIFYHEQPDLFPHEWPHQKDIADVLVRERNLELPMWAHAGRPALTQIFSELRSEMQREKLGFSGSADLKIGLEWMLSLTNVLYALSPFHSKMKSRGFTIPSTFAFSAGANDYKKKGRSEPIMTQDLLREVNMSVRSEPRALSLVFNVFLLCTGAIEVELAHALPAYGLARMERMEDEPDCAG